MYSVRVCVCLYEGSLSVHVCSEKLMRSTRPPLTFLFIPRCNENLIELPMKIKRNNGDNLGAGTKRHIDVGVRLICVTFPAVNFMF
jgi:hypothetical protein